MVVIPFNPKRAGGTGQPRCPGGSIAGACPSGSAPRHGGHPASADDPRERIDVLERALIAALRENAANWARAKRAERLLRDDSPVGLTAD